MRFPIITRYPDYDSKGHVNNAVYLTYFEMARQRAWLECLEGSPDFPFIIAEATVRYLSQARIGDALDIEISTAEVRNKAWVWSYVIREPSTGRIVADGRTVQVMYDYDTHRSVPIPEPLRSALASM